MGRGVIQCSRSEGGDSGNRVQEWIGGGDGRTGGQSESTAIVQGTGLKV